MLTRQVQKVLGKYFIIISAWPETVKKYGSKRNKDLTSQTDSTITSYPNEEERGFGRYRNGCNCSGNSDGVGPLEREHTNCRPSNTGAEDGNQWLGQGEPHGKAREGKN